VEATTAPTSEASGRRQHHRRRQHGADALKPGFQAAVEQDQRQRHRPHQIGGADVVELQPAGAGIARQHADQQEYQQQRRAEPQREQARQDSGHHQNRAEKDRYADRVERRHEFLQPFGSHKSLQILAIAAGVNFASSVNGSAAVNPVCQFFVYFAVSPQASGLCVSHHESHTRAVLVVRQHLSQLYELHRCVLLPRSALQQPKQLNALSGLVFGCWAFTGAKGFLRPGLFAGEIELIEMPLDDRAELSC